MKKSKFTEQQIAFALQQAESGRTVAECAGRWNLRGDVLSLWTALPTQDDFDLISLASCKHLSGVIRWIRAPKWVSAPARLYSR